MGKYTDSYHLHVTTLEVAVEISRGGWLRGVLPIVTAIAVVGNIINGDLLFGVHDWIGRGCDVEGGGREQECSTTREEGGGWLLCKEGKEGEPILSEWGRLRAKPRLCVE